MNDSATYEQLVALAPTTVQVVGPEHLDLNGHMNIGHYYSFASHAMWSLNQSSLGMAVGYIEAHGMTTFTAEQHLRFLAESHEGDELAIVARPVERGSRTLFTAAAILNRTRGTLACVVETMLVHVDFGTRRPTAFPDHVMATIDASIADAGDAAIPLSGAIGIRR